MSRPHPHTRGVRTRASLALAALLALALAAALAACGGSDDDGNASTTAGGGDAAAQLGAVRFGTDPAFPPLEYLDGDELVGAEIELARGAVAAQGGEAEFMRGAFDTLIPSLKAGRVDALASGFYDRTTRREGMQFVRFMREVGVGALFRAEDAPPDDSPEHLCGLTVAAGAGTGSEKLIRQLTSDCAEPPKLVLMPDESAAQLAVQSGRADAFATGFLAVSHIARTAGGGETFEAIAYPPEPGEEQVYYALAFPGEATRLATAVQEGLQQLIDDGTYGEIMKRYGLEDLTIERAELVSSADAIERCVEAETCDPDS